MAEGNFESGIVGARSGSASNRALAASFGHVMDLQASYKSANTPEMQERGLIIRDEIPQALRAWLPEFEPIVGPLAVEGRDGTGLKTRVPWCRIFSPSKSPAATDGWYLVYLFAVQRPEVYLSLITGTMRWAGGQFVPKPTALIESMVASTRLHLSSAGLTPADALTSIELGDPGALGPSYESGTVYAYRYERSNLPADEVLKADIQRMLPALADLYREAPPPKVDGGPTEPSDFELEFDRLARVVQTGNPNDSGKWKQLEAHIAQGLGLGADSRLGAKGSTVGKEIGNRFGEALDQGRDPLFMFVSDEVRATALAKARSHTRVGRFSLVALCGVAPETDLMTILDVVFSGKGVQLASQLASLFPLAHIPPIKQWGLDWDAATLASIRGELLIDDEVVVQCLVALAAGRHLLLTGPPGTAKSTLATRLAAAAAEAGVAASHVVATATADWTSFDTIGGYFPTGQGMELKFHEGVVTRSISSDSWCLIDEINRAHVDRAVGPLITLVGGATEVAVELPQKNEVGQPISISLDPTSPISRRTTEGDYMIGTNWRLIATMNSFDKNALFPLSAAFTRRFASVVVGIPDPSQMLDVFEVPPSGTARRLFTVVMTESAPDGWVNRRPLGPAIVKDAWEFVTKLSGKREPSDRELVQALALFVLPQYVGLEDRAYAELRSRLVACAESPDEFAEQLDRFFRGVRGQ